MNTVTDQNPGNKQQDTRFEIQKVYLKDLSFESPNAPAVFQGASQPSLHIAIQTTWEPLENDRLDVRLRITLSASNDDVTLFLIETEQGGVFLADGFDDNQKAELIETQCTNALFPFAREAIWSVIGKGGFPAMLVQQMDFSTLRSLVDSADSAP